MRSRARSSSVQRTKTCAARFVAIVAESERLTRKRRSIVAMMSETSVVRRGVLLIEDDLRLLRALARVLEFDGFRVLTATDARSASALAREHGAHINVIVTDIMLPDASATELAVELAVTCPGAPILFMSGAPTEGAILPALSVPTAFLPKPFSPQDLKSALRGLKVL